MVSREKIFKQSTPPSKRTDSSALRAKEPGSAEQHVTSRSRRPRRRLGGPRHILGLRSRRPGTEPNNPQNPKKQRKKLRHTLPRVGPQKHEKNTEKKTVISGPFGFFFGGGWGAFFLYFGEPSWVGDLAFFRQFPRTFRFQGFLGSVPGRRDRNPQIGIH